MHEVRVEGIRGLGGIVHHAGGVFRGLGIVVIDIEAHVLVLRHPVFLGRGQVEVGLGQQTLGGGLVHAAGLRLGIVRQQLDGLLKVGDDVAPLLVQRSGQAGGGIVDRGHHLHVHGHAAEIAGEVEIGIGAHEVGLAGEPVLERLVDAHARDVLDHGVGAVDGDVGELEEVAQRHVAAEVVHAPRIQVLGALGGVALRIQFVGVHAAQEHDGAGVFDVVDGIVDIHGGGLCIGLRPVEVALRVEAVGFLFQGTAGQADHGENAGKYLVIHGFAH